MDRFANHLCEAPPEAFEYHPYSLVFMRNLACHRPPRKLHCPSGSRPALRHQFYKLIESGATLAPHMRTPIRSPGVGL